MTRPIAEDVAAIARIDAVPKILEVVCRATGMGFAAVARVTEHRWVACAVLDNIEFGLKPGGELKVETTICNEIRESGQPIVIDHVADDEVFCRHPTPAMYGFQSYISMPIVDPRGGFFGTLCAIDPRPARLKRPEIVGMFRLFAELIALHLETHERIAASEAALLGERQGRELRDQFIAVLGHDLRNPLAAIDAGARLLRKEPIGQRGASILNLVQNSVTRMAELIDNVLDFARSRLGTGIMVERSATAMLEPALEQVIEEFRAAWPDRVIVRQFALGGEIDCDLARVAQLLSNLLGNAVTHGAPDKPVVVQASRAGNTFELAVANQGDPIPASMRARLFEPFFRGGTGGRQQGLGLGLYIASAIARAHGGTLDVASSPAETRFTFRMPLKPPDATRTTSATSAS
jgi:signal transduction histidine kinase